VSFVNTSSQIITEQTAAHLTPQAGYIFTGVFAILIFASVIGQWLKRKNGADNATISNLNARIYAWWLMTLVLLVAFWFGKTGTVALFFLISFAALREFMTLVYRRRSDYYSMVVCFYLLLPVHLWAAVWTCCRGLKWTSPNSAMSKLKNCPALRKFPVKTCPATG